MKKRTEFKYTSCKIGLVLCALVFCINSLKSLFHFAVSAVSLVCEHKCGELDRLV